MAYKIRHEIVLTETGTNLVAQLSQNPNAIKNREKILALLKKGFAQLRDTVHISTLGAGKAKAVVHSTTSGAAISLQEACDEDDNRMPMPIDVLERAIHASEGELALVPVQTRRGNVIPLKRDLIIQMLNDYSSVKMNKYLHAQRDIDEKRRFALELERLKITIEEESRKAALEAARRKAAADEEARKAALEEARRKAAAEEEDRKMARELQMRKAASEEEDRRVERELQILKAASEEEDRKMARELERLKFDREEAISRQKLEMESREAERRAEERKRWIELKAQFMQTVLWEDACIHMSELIELLVADGKYKRASNAKAALQREWNKKQQHTSIPARVVSDDDDDDLPNAGVYVLSAQDGYFDTVPITMHSIVCYVGKSNDIGMRLQQHAGGNDGSALIVRQNPYLNKRVPTLTTALDGGAAWEFVETMHRMRQHGISHVRGGCFATPTIDFRMAFRLICAHFDLCHNCGMEGHFTAGCTRTAFIRWGEPF